jgi:O-antigen/teichoic acid export membrane protein
MRLLRRNLLGVYGIYAASIVSGLVVTPVVLHAIGDIEFGVWSFIGSLTIYLALLDVGVGPSVVRFGAEYRGRKAPEETNALASTGLAIYAAVGLVTIPVGLVLAYLAPLLVDAPEDLVWPTRVATALLVAGIVLRFPLGLFSNLLVAQQRWDVTNLGNALSIALYATAVLMLLPRTGGVVLLAALTLGTTIVRLGLPLLWVRRELPGLHFSRVLVTRDRARELLSFSWQNFLLHVAGKVIFSADLIVVGIVLGLAAATLYALPEKLFALGFGLATAGTNLLYPVYAELEGAAEQDRQRRLFRSGLRAGMATTLVIALPFVFIPDQLLHAWVGPGFGESAPVLALLGCVLLIHQPITLVSQFLIARARQQRLAIFLIATVAANVVLSVVLAKAVGTWGVALSTLVTDLVALAYIVPALVTPASGVSPVQLLGDMLRPVVPALAAAVVVLVGVARLFEVETLLGLVPLGVLWVAVAGLLVLRFGLGADERSALGRMAGGRAAPSIPQFGEEI